MRERKRKSLYRKLVICASLPYIEVKRRRRSLHMAPFHFLSIFYGESRCGGDLYSRILFLIWDEMSLALLRRFWRFASSSSSSYIPKQKSKYFPRSMSLLDFLGSSRAWLYQGFLKWFFMGFSNVSYWFPLGNNSWTPFGFIMNSAWWIWVKQTKSRKLLEKVVNSLGFAPLGGGPLSLFNVFYNFGLVFDVFITLAKVLRVFYFSKLKIYMCLKKHNVWKNKLCLE